MVQHPARLVRQVRQVIHQLAQPGRGERPPHLAQHTRQHIQVHQRRRKRLGTGHANLRPGMHGNVPIRDPHRLAADSIHNRPQQRPLLARQFTGRQRVRRLARLANGQHRRIFVQQRRIITKLRSVLHLHRNSGDRFNHILAHQPGVIAGAARDNEDFAQPPHQLWRQIHLRQLHPAGVKRHPPAHRVNNRPRLLKDLLLHKMLKLPLHRAYRVPGNAVHRHRHRLPIQRRHLVAIPSQQRQLAVLQEHHLARVFQNGRYVGSHKHFPLPQTQGNAPGIANARANQLVGMVHRHRHHRIRPVQQGKRLARRRQPRQASGQIPLQELHNHLGVCFRLKAHPFRLQLFAQRQEVLDNAVVHHRHPAGHAHVGMRVTLGRLAMRRPARMANANVPHQRRFRQHALQVMQLAHIPAHGDMPVLRQHGNAGRVIATIFKPFQAVQDHGRGLARPKIPNNSTHNCLQVVAMAGHHSTSHCPAVARAEQAACSIQLSSGTRPRGVPLAHGKGKPTTCCQPCRPLRSVLNGQLPGRVVRPLVWGKTQGRGQPWEEPADPSTFREGGQPGHLPVRATARWRTSNLVTPGRVGRGPCAISFAHESMGHIVARPGRKVKWVRQRSPIGWMAAASAQLKRRPRRAIMPGIMVMPPAGETPPHP